MRFSFFSKIGQLFDGWFTMPGLPDSGGNQDAGTGTDVIDFEVAGTYVELSGDSVSWAGLPLAAEQAKGGFLVSGGDREVIAAIIQNLLQSALSNSSRQPSRALVLDNNRNWLSVLSSIDLEIPTVIVNPFDERGVAWDMAADIRSASTAYRFAQTLFPEASQAVPRTITTGIIEALIQKSGDRWQLRDVALFLQSLKATKALLRECEFTHHLVYEWLQNPDAVQSFDDAVEESKSLFSEIASGWDSASSGKTFSFSKWFESDPSILLLGDHPNGRPLMGRINSFLLDHFVDRLTGQGQQGSAFQGKTWVVLDDICHGKTQDRLSELLIQGADRGACTVLGVDSMAQLVSDYGNEKARRVFGACKNQLFLRTDDPASAELMAGRFLSMDPNTFADLPKPTVKPRLKIEGIARSGAVPHPFRTCLTEDSVPTDIYTADFSERSPVPLRNWTESDLDRLSLSSLKSVLLQRTEGGSALDQVRMDHLDE